MKEPVGQGKGSADVRLSLVAASFLFLAILVGAVIAARSSGPARAASPPPPACVSVWNSNPRALVLGYHSFHRHGYREAEVVRLNILGETAAQGSCAVVFPSTRLDRESAVAAKIYRSARWAPLSNTVTEARLSLLQFAAIQKANAALRPDGTLLPTR